MIDRPIVKTDPMQQTAEDVFDVTGYQELEKYGVAFVNNAYDELSLRARKRCSPAADTPLECDTFRPEMIKSTIRFGLL
jgi:hypothetical protein